MEPIRSPEQLRRHYQLERRLADRLRTAGQEERGGLYAELYDELFRRVPDHPQLARKADPRMRQARVEKHFRTVGRFLAPGGTYLEIGAGDCALASRVASGAARAYAVEVSKEIVAADQMPPNLDLLITDGTSIPVPRGSVNVAFSDQVMEHLHPEDAVAQLRNVYEALTEGGVYICITPNRLSGPHDISKYFDPVATGFHLKEYTTGELAALMRGVGFSRTFNFVTLGSRTMLVPLAVTSALERAVVATRRLGRHVARSQIGARALGNRLVAFK